MAGRRRDWAATLLRPQVLLAALALVASLPYLFGSFAARRSEPPPPSLVDVSVGGERTVAFDAPLVLYDLAGRPRTVQVPVQSAEGEAARLTAAAAALREALLDDGVWPQEVGPPRVGAFESNRRRVVVVDVPVPRGVSTSVAAESAALRSIVETMRALGADDVRVVVDGGPRDTLWGNVALP